MCGTFTVHDHSKGDSVDIIINPNDDKKCFNFFGYLWKCIINLINVTLSTSLRGVIKLFILIIVTMRYRACPGKASCRSTPRQ